jgi:AraC family transcriptional regulator, transcriptional activator of the genes for pyochelin and ferripyochelin receptors
MEKKYASQADSAIYPGYIISRLTCVKNIIETDIGKHFILKQLAQKAGTNEFSLKKGFKHLFKSTIYQHLLKKRMIKANELLLGTNLKVKEIAKECGYETLSGFITSFRKYYGIQPGQLRKPISD